MARRCRPGAFEAMIKNPKNPALFLFFATAVLSVLLEGTAAAQKMFSPKLDLESAVSKAIESDPEIRSSQTLSKISKERIREARTGWGPTVQISQSFTRSNNPAFVFSSLLEQGRFTGANFSSNSLSGPLPVPLFSRRGSLNRSSPRLHSSPDLSRHFSRCRPCPQSPRLSDAAGSRKRGD